MQTSVVLGLIQEVSERVFLYYMALTRRQY